MIDALLVRQGKRKLPWLAKRAIGRDAYLMPSDGEWWERLLSDPWWRFVRKMTRIGLWQVDDGDYYRNGRFGKLLPGND